MDSDSNVEEEEQAEVIDEAAHKKLVANVLNLSRQQHVSKTSRTEAASHISEFDLVKASTNLRVNDLANVLTKKGKQNEIGKRIRRTQQKSTAIPRPLEVVQSERIHRTVVYGRAQDALDKWDPIVASMRSAAHTAFPLCADKDAKLTNKDFDDDWGYRTDLQRGLEEIQAAEVPAAQAAPNEDEVAFPMSMEEAMEKRREAAKLRAFESYRMAKARRQNKIKSKQYHRIQRKEKMRQQMKEFEVLQATNPEAALVKLEELERARVEERMSLRHKNTGKWAKSQLIRAKYDKDARKLLKEQLTLSRDFTQKRKNAAIEGESDDEMESEHSPNAVHAQKGNPWIKASKEVEDFVSGYRKYWEETCAKQKPNNANDEVVGDNGMRGNNSATNNDKTNKHGIKASEDEYKGCRTKKRCQSVASIADLALKRQPRDGYEEDAIKIGGMVAENIESGGLVMKNNKIAKRSKKNKRIIQTGVGDWEVTDNVDEGINGLDGIDKAFHMLNDKLKKKIENVYKNLRKQSANDLRKVNVGKTKKARAAKRKSSLLEQLSLPKPHTRPEIDEELNETVNRKLDGNKKQAARLTNGHENEGNSASHSHLVDIDPNELVPLKPISQLNSALPDLLNHADNEEEEAGKQREIIEEAFENDDILENFEEEKQNDIDASKPKDIDLTLPGWGSWGGKDIKVSANKRKRFLVKFSEPVQRKDRHKSSLIINENGDTQIKAHMVSELPYPFRNVRDFEASMRAPIGSTFVPETAFRNLTRPAVTAKLGSIIEPMSTEMLIKKKK